MPALALLRQWQLTAVLLSVVTSVCFGLVCTPGLEVVADAVGVKGYTSGEMVDHVLGPYVPSPNLLRDKKLQWANQARDYAGRLEGAARLRADVYELLLKEIKRRGEDSAARYKDNKGLFEYRRITISNGTELFCGPLGNFFEIRPDGTNYFGMIRTFESTDIFDPDWLPPFDAKGNPDERRVISRQRFDPNYRK